MARVVDAFRGATTDIITLGAIRRPSSGSPLCCNDMGESDTCTFTRTP